MNKKKFFRPVVLALGMLALQSGRAQVSTASNNPFVGDYVGCDGLTTFPLEVRHNGNQPIEWYTDSLLRMRLTPTLTNQSWAWYNANNLDLSGHLGIGSPTPQRPLTYLHLNSANLQGITVGYRPWMRVGVFSTQGTDGMYAGMRALNGSTESVINWSDDDNAGNAQDHLCFVFTSTPDSSNTASRYGGLEIARMIPDPNGNEGYFGLGDWHTASLQPTERLDLLDGSVRIRDLPTGLEMDTTDKYVVVNEDGVLGWRNIPTGTGGADCDWAQDASHNLYTAIAAVNPGSCPDLDNRVAIGNYPSLTTAKLHVEQRPRTGANEVAMKAVALVGADYDWSEGYGLIASATIPAAGTPGKKHYGVKAFASNAHEESFGVYASATNDTSYTTTRNVGVYGHGAGNAVSHGVYGHASGSGTNYGLFGWVQASSTNNNYAVYGLVTAGDTTDWAGWFQGKVFATAYETSDESLKQNIEDLSMEEATDVLSALSIHTYEYRTDEFAEMNLPAGTRAGVLAHELEAVLPHLVTGAVQPEMIDSAGNVIQPSVAFRAVNYTGLIPYLIAGYQASNARTAELEDQLIAQNERLDQLESMLLDCCNRGTPDGDQLPEQEQGLLNGRSNERSMQVVPNPFQTETTIHYNLDRGGRVQLMANSADGKQLRVLNDATSEAGVYQFNWNTADLAAGIYYVTLLLDGEPITKRAVKIDR